LEQNQKIVDIAWNSSSFVQVETLIHKDHLNRENNSQASLCYKRHFLIDDIASEYKLKMALNVRSDYGRHS